MSDQFRDRFVGEKGYDTLKKLMKNGNDFCIDAAKCLQERCDAEIIYAKSLRKTSDTLEKLAGRTKGTLAQAFTTLGTQTSKEYDAHQLIAATLQNDISMPLKGLAETQTKERKSIEETLYGKFKEWNAQKDLDNKYRSRQFEKSREIETLTNKISELSSGSKSSSKSKASTISTPMMMCVLPAGRHTSVSDKSTTHSDVKHHNSLESSIKKAEEDLEKIDTKYHLSTRNVELLRQACDTEMSRNCDKMQTMEFDRIQQIAGFIQTYSTAIQTLTQTMHQITQDLYAIQVSPENDIIVQARSNVQPAEYEILLYDIYAENEDNVMGQQRRILSLMKWMEMLKRDIEMQQQTKNASLSSLSSASHSQKADEDDDRGSSDGAMCSSSSSSKTDVVRNAVQHRDASSSSSNDDDGGMYHSKREKKKSEGGGGFSSEVFIDRRGSALLEELYQASLYKIESVYNRLKKHHEPVYEHATCLARTYNDKGCATTFLRLPVQPFAHTPPSAPSATKCFAQAMPMFVKEENPKHQMTMLTSMQRQAPPLGWAMPEPMMASSAPDNQATPYGAKYVAQQPVKHVRALYSYTAQHTDELDLKEGDIIVVMERRKDAWFKGNLDGKIGLFPGNYVVEI